MERMEEYVDEGTLRHRIKHARAQRRALSVTVAVEEQIMAYLHCMQYVLKLQAAVVGAWCGCKRVRRRRAAAVAADCAAQWHLEWHPVRQVRCCGFRLRCAQRCDVPVWWLMGRRTFHPSRTELDLYVHIK